MSIQLRVVAALCLVCAFSFAQTNRGSINGTVRDPTGAVVPGASVTVVNAGTNETRRVKTTDLGTFTVADLEPVTYTVTIEAQGFKKEVVQGVKVDTSSSAGVNVKLTTGSVATEITVSASTTTINTESGTTSATINQREIRDAPLVNRSVLDLALTLPNVSGDAGTENPSLVSVTTCPGCNLSINGSRPLSTLMMADGVNNTGISLARTMVSFSPEVVQEFTVISSVYSSEYGDTGGGVINVTTKSGTNDFHGTALWYNRNPNFAAAPFTQASANRPVPTTKYNQFHGSIGGPVIIPKLYNGKNKTFFFFAYEPFYRRDRLDQYGLLPTDGMRKGDFSGLVNTNSGWLPAAVVAQFASIAPSAVLTTNTSAIYQNYNLVNGNQFQMIAPPVAGSTYAQFPNNVIPTAFLDAAAIKSLAYIAPAGPYYLNSNGLISNAYLPRLLSQDEKRTTIRVDHVFNDKNRIYGRYTGSPILKIQGTPVSSTTNAAEYSYAKQAMVAYTHTFTPTQFNDLRLNYTRGRFSNTVDPMWDPVSGQNLNTILGLPTITAGGLPILGGLFPGSSLGGGGSTATGLGTGGSTSVEDHEERYGVTDIYYWSHKNMNFKFGFDGSRSLQNVIPLFAAYGGSYAFAANQTSSSGASATSGAAFASYLLGVPSASPTLRNVEVPYYYRWSNYSGFVQNDWRMTPNLTVNLGLRYNIETPRVEKYDNQGYFDLSKTQSVNLPTPLTLQDGEVIKSTLEAPFLFSGRGGNRRGLTPENWLDFEPRFGFAWSPGVLQSRHVVIRGGYTLSHVPLSGLTRLPAPDFGATSTFAVGSTTAAGAIVASGTANPTYVMRLGENPPLLSNVTVAGVVGAPSSGMVMNNSLYYQQASGGYAISPNFHSPYVQNWNLTTSWQLDHNTTLELSYVGNKGTHLFLPHENVNPKDIPLAQAQIAQNISTTATVADPLGRINPATGTLLQVQQGSLGSPYLGFSSLYVLYDSAANSIRHGGYISMTHISGPLTFTANYTYAKSIDDASSAGGDKNILTPVGGQTDGQISLGGTRKNDRSVSTYDQRHVINTTAYYILPFGRGQRFGGNMWAPADLLLGGWQVSGIARFSSGFPMMPTIADTNLLGDLTHTTRPDIVPGVPLINPLWDRNCPAGANCQPYLNPSAFERPALGALGTAPRTLDSVRGPWDQTFDFSVQKNFKIKERANLQFRVDLLNALNHPIFRVFPNNAGGTDLYNAAPSAADPAAGAGGTEFNNWAAANGVSASTAACASAYAAACNNSTSAGDIVFRQVRDQIDAFRPKLTPGQGACTAALAGTGSCLGGLPANFFNVPLPANFFGANMNQFDIRTANGFKLFRLRQQLNTAGGDLYQIGLSRYIQFGLKFTF